MQPKDSISSVLKVGLCVMLALGVVEAGGAQEKKVDPTGTWTWTRPDRQGGADIKMTLRLKAQGDKLTGKLTSPRREGGDPVELEVKDGKIKGEEISFTVTRDVNSNAFRMKYHGKVGPNAIKGKMEIERDGQTQSRDWEAKREAERK